MPPIIGIKIENKHLVELIPLRRRAGGLLKLTTLKPGQRKASVKVYLVRGRKKDCIAEFLLQNLQYDRVRVPAIDLKAEYNGWFRLSLTLVLNGRVAERKEVPLAGFLLLRKLAGRVLPFLLLSLLAVLFFLVFLPRLRDSTRPPPPAAFAAEREQPAAPAEPAGASPDESPAAAPVPAETAGAVSPPVANAAAETRAEETPPATGEQAGRQAAEVSRLDTITVYFGPDSASLAPEARERLLTALDDLKGYREGVSITGHCASFGTESGRMDLSERRAEAVSSFLRERGWRPSAAPVVEGYGSRKPVTRETDRQYLNRRVEIAPVR